MAKQKLLRMITLDRSLRSKVDSWDHEDGNMIDLQKEIGLSGSPSGPCYQTVMHAIGDGWRLMAPPVFIKDYAKNIDGWEWWLQNG